MDKNQAWTICVFFICCTIVLWRYMEHRENMAGLPIGGYGGDEYNEDYEEFERKIADVEGKEESVEGKTDETDKGKGIGISID